MEKIRSRKFESANRFWAIMAGIVLFMFINGNAFSKDFQWKFDKENNANGWVLSGLDNAGIVDGSLKLIAKVGNPMLYTPLMEVKASDQKIVKFRMKLGDDIKAKGCLLFVTDSSPDWSDATIVNFDCHCGGGFYDYKVDMSKNPLWKGTVTKIRFQPFYIGGKPTEDEQIVVLEYFQVVE